MTEIDTDTIKEALKAWSDRTVYLCSNGVYRFHCDGRPVSWNKVIRRAFPASDLLHAAAQDFKATGKAYLPRYYTDGNIRVMFYGPNVTVVHVWDNEHRKGNPVELNGTAARLIRCTAMASSGK